MNTATSLGTAATLARSGIDTTSAAGRSVLMTCEVCDLAGGPFAPAEAAYLRAIHNRVHHGFSEAA